MYIAALDRIKSFSPFARRGQHRYTMAQGDTKCRQLTIHSLSGSQSTPMCGLGSRAFAVTGSPFRRFWSGCQAGHPSSRSWPIILSSKRMTSSPCTLTPPNWRGARSPEDEAPLRRKLSPRLVLLLRDLFPDSESALRNGLACAGDRRILDYAAAHDFILVSTDSDFERLLSQIPGAKVVILRSCDYPTGVAAEVLRRNAIRIAELPGSQDRLIILDQ